MKKKLPRRFWKYDEWENKDEYMKYFNFTLPFNLKTQDFKKITKNIITPTIKELGFKGFGFRFIKKNENGYIHLIELKATKYGGGCEVFIGIHLDFLPANFWLNKDLNKIKIHECFLTKRITLPNENVIFNYGNNENEAIETSEYIVKCLKEQAIPFFKKFNNFPEPFNKITIENFKKKDFSLIEKEIENTGFGFYLSLIRILYLTNKKDESKAIIKYLFENNTKLNNNFLFKPLFKRLLKNDTNFYYSDNELKKISEDYEKAIANKDVYN
ncbi:MAG: DUF4304 domain-containing protein [Algibacter sp.]